MFYIGAIKRTIWVYLDWTDRQTDRVIPVYHPNIVAAFRGMHVSPVKHSYAWLPRKCDYGTDTQTERRTEFEKGQNLYCQLVWDFYHVDDLFPHSQENPALPSKNNPDTSGYFNMNFIPCLIALLITQSAQSWVLICEQYWWYLFKYYVILLIWSTVLAQDGKMFYLRQNALKLVFKLLGIISLA